MSKKSIELFGGFHYSIGMSVKLIIFDLDGTIIDSSIDIANAINYAIEPYGVAAVSVKEVINLVGEGISKLMEKIRIKEGIGVETGILTGRFLFYYSSHLIDNTTVYPGVRETLAQLGAYRKAVISNKIEALSVKIIDQLRLSEYMDIIVGSDTTKERKPSPVPVRHVLSALGIPPEEAVIVGDSDLDIEAGKSAGTRTVAVTYGYRPVNLLQEADFIINNMNELTDVLKGLS